MVIRNNLCPKLSESWQVFKDWFKVLQEMEEKSFSVLKISSFLQVGRKKWMSILLLLGYLTEQEVRNFSDQKWGQKTDCWNYRKYFLSHPDWLCHSLLTCQKHSQQSDRNLIKMSVKTAEWSKCTWKIAWNLPPFPCLCASSVPIHDL